MNYLSVCSGIEAATVAWHPLGWNPIAFSEIEKFPCKVLAHHYPDVPNLGDMTKFKEWSDYANVDVLVGGTPCQSFSIAGLRKGLDDPRGNLMLTYLAIADKYCAPWLVWENVPGVLSSNNGRDFGTFLWGLGQLGYGFAYRVLDAQYVRTDGYAYAVPQRRRRVFVVGYLGDWRRAAAVLFDSESLHGNPPPRREAGKTVAGTISKCSFTGGASGRVDGAVAEHFQVARQSAGICLPEMRGAECKDMVSNMRMVRTRTDFDLASGLQVAPCMTSARMQRIGDPTGQDCIVRSVALRGREGGATAELGDDVAFTLRASTDGGDKPHAICMSTGQAGAEIGIGTTLNCNHEAPIAFTARDYGNDATQDVAPTMRSLSKSADGHQSGAAGLAVAYPINMQAATKNGAKSPNMLGIGQDGDPSPTINASDRHAVAYRTNAAGQVDAQDGISAALNTQTDPCAQILAVKHESLCTEGIKQGGYDACSQKTNAGNILSRVRKEIGAQAFAEWGLGILDSLQSPEILQQAMHGKELRQATFTRSWVVCCALGSPFNCSEGAMQSLREACGERCSSQGWQSLEQLAGELGAYLSELSHHGAQAERFMQDLWEADEGAGVLRETLSAIQEIRRPIHVQGESAHSVMQVRRLTVSECSSLQGFPRHYLHQVPGASDTQMYKALGNSMAVNVIQLIGQRIDMVSQIKEAAHES